MSVRRVVIDTNIFVSALMSPSGNPAKIHNMFLAGELSLVFNSDIYEEYQDVLFRQHLGIPLNQAEKVLVAVRYLGEKIEVFPSANAMIDEDDRVFYDTAKSAGAYLISGNKKHYPDEPFIFSPTEFLELPGTARPKLRTPKLT